MTRIIVALAFAFISALTETQPAFAQQTPRKIVFLTDAGPLGRHSPFFVALAKGFYKEEGLDVEILGGRGSAATIREVAAGAATFGFADAGTLILSRANEAVPAKMVGIVYAQAPHGLMALAESGIKGPQDLKGKKLADTSASSNYILFKAYAQKVGLDPKSVEWIFTDFNSLPGLLATRQVDAIGQFSMGKPMLQKRAGGREVTFLSYAAAGMEFYSNVIIASDETIARDPKLVSSFLRATERGMKDAFANPAEAAELMRKYLPLLEADIIASETKNVGELANPAERKDMRMLVLDPAKVNQTVSVIQENFELKNKISSGDVSAKIEF
jgi:NitT/TauT family transport system substrate-binding protein